MGFPSFDYSKGNSEFMIYVSYLFACIRQQAAERRVLVSMVEKFNNVKPEDKALFEDCLLRNPGGWPLRVGGVYCSWNAGDLDETDEGFTKFWLPPLPITLS